MADESELRRMLEREADAVPGTELDAGRLVRRSRARRLPRQLAAGGVATIAVLGLGVGTATGIRLLNPPASRTSAESGGLATDEGSPQEEAGTLSAPELEGGAGDGAAGGGIQLAPAYKVNLCGGTLAAPAVGDATGIHVDLEFPDTAAISAVVSGSVVITNTSDARLSGVLSDAAATTLSDDGLVLWHTPRLDRTLPVDLAPGASATIDAAFEPRICAVEDDSRDQFRADLPAVDPGQYDVSVAFDVELADGTVLQVVSGTEPITLR